jgi:CRISPR-associated protein Cas2
MNTNKYMRILVFFDLPVKSKEDRKVASKFRDFLLKDGYHMVQFSVYARVCNGYDAVIKHENRINSNLPRKGSVRMLVITEKQYESVRILVGSPTKYDTISATEQLTFL